MKATWILILSHDSLVDPNESRPSIVYLKGGRNRRSRDTVGSWALLGKEKMEKKITLKRESLC